MDINLGISGWIDEQRWMGGGDMNGWIYMDGWMDGWMNGWMDR